MSYGANLPNVYRQSARLMDKIFKGASPADLTPSPIRSSRSLTKSSNEWLAATAYLKSHLDAGNSSSTGARWGERNVEMGGYGGSLPVCWHFHDVCTVTIGSKICRRGLGSRLTRSVQ